MDRERDSRGRKGGKDLKGLTSDSLYWKEGGLKWKVKVGKLLL